MRRAGCLVALAAVLVVAAALWQYGHQDYRPIFSRTAGTLVAVRDSTEVGAGPDGKRLTDVVLVSDTGLRVRVRVRGGGAPTGERRPAAILLGGFKSGRSAVEVPPFSADLVLASIDYPYEGPRKDLSAWQWMRHAWGMRRAVLETPAALLLVAQYLYSRDDVDPRRVSMIGVSLGAPFAVAAAATDRRLAGAVLLHGGGDIRTLFAHTFSESLHPRLVGPVSTLVDWLLAPLEPTRYAGEIAPRPILMVNAASDESVPPESVLALYRAARQPKRLVWIETAHVRASNEEVVGELMQRTLDWMEERGLR